MLTNRYDAFSLDRMMPQMDGMAVLSRIRGHADLTQVPVIFQSARGGKEDIREGPRAGAYYHLSKPFEREALRSIVRAALAEGRDYLSLEEAIQKHPGVLGLMNQGVFVYRTLHEAHVLASILARTCRASRSAVLGLSELMINAVEHGNLDITYADKSRLNASGAWSAEVDRRLQMEEYCDRVVIVTLEKDTGAVCISIADQGTGFDWEQYLEMHPDRAFDSHGRGIALANRNCFESLAYSGNGNKVTVMTGCSSDESEPSANRRHKRGPAAA